MADFVLALGSNMGSRGGFLSRALSMLAQFCEVKKVSQIYETPPVGYLNQGDFLNCAAFCSAEIEPFALLEKCGKIEAQLGRVRAFKDSPRTIDIDIIFYDDIKMQTPALEIPHPRWSGRDFVITPLLDLRDGGEFDSQKFAFVKNFLKDKRRKFEPVKDYERR